MFGYIKPAYPELLVKQYELYRAVYCGICEETRRISLFLPLALSYDLVYLALTRAALTGESFTFEKKRCLAHPLRKRSIAKACPVLSYTAKASLILTLGKLEDDISDKDKSFFKRLILRPYRSILSRKLKRLMKEDGETEKIYTASQESLKALGELEKARSSNPDGCATVFSRTIKDICSLGLEGTERIIAEQLGESVGRIVYLYDAVEDIFDDEKTSSFNPFLNKYGSSREFISHINEIDMAMSMYIEKADNISALLPNDSELTPILKNITSYGLSTELRRIMDNTVNKTKTKAKKGDLNDRSL